MADDHLRALIPSTVSFSLGGTEVKIVEYSLNLSFDNGSKYEETTDAEGKKNYMLHKGTKLETGASDGATITIPQTPDEAYDASIKHVKEALEHAEKNVKPSDYNKDLIWSFTTAGDKKFLDISFSGHVKEFKEEVAAGTTSFSKHTAHFVVADPATVDVKK